MDLSNEFRVDASPAVTWSVLTDLERIAPCLPGAQLQEVEGDEYRGIVKVKVGPVTAQYKGTATFLERDEAAHRAVLKADGRETRGQGNASATITVTLVPDGTGTQVSVLTDLRITGKVAQFGRGVISDVSANLLGRFVESLESTVLRGDTTTPASPTAAVPGPGLPPAPAPAAPGARTIHQPEPEPVNLFDAAGSPVVKRLAPVLVAFVAGWLLSSLFRQGRG
ncbi:carbon monoxide dehydrogenase [Parafrankia soli]|uniref:Carbon monoxide dehydrogenase n=1 Tax=Parafrankia soli TaxID=2599596 RepID=A0A1S1PDD8_9ACTN|nr:SRPBCC family protein [Parafrankia soli]OHV19261.1 carbon monoxide dehydrogenase [Parafrankia soli]